jgi:hypothetical protein
MKLDSRGEIKLKKRLFLILHQTNTWGLQLHSRSAIRDHKLRRAVTRLSPCLSIKSSQLPRLPCFSYLLFEPLSVSADPRDIRPVVSNPSGANTVPRQGNNRRSPVLRQCRSSSFLHCYMSFLSIKVLINLRQSDTGGGETAQGRAATRVKQEVR